MTESTILFLGPEESMAILKEIFSSKKSSAVEISMKIGKNRGTVLNAIHDLKILSLINEGLEPSNEARNIVYQRGIKETLKERFILIKGNKEATDEINDTKNFDPLEVGRVFCFHTNARASKDSSLRQIGRLYLRWLKYVGLINESESESEDKNG